MKIYFYFILTLTYCLSCSGQNLILRINGSTSIEKKIIDSLQYNAQHSNLKSIQDEITKTTDRLTAAGYIAVKTQDSLQKNDSTYTTTLKLGQKVKIVYLTISKNTILKQLPELKSKDTISIPYSDINPFLIRSTQVLEQLGFALVRLNLKNITILDTSLFAELHVRTDQKRLLSAITIKYEAEGKNTLFPKGHASQINKKYKKRIFNKSLLQEIYQDFENFQFVIQTKYPEILFTTDSTKVYVYLEKRKSNTFDGFIGFSNNETNTIQVNGYADIKLSNILGAGEQASLYWKSDGNDQKTFNASIELPYLWQSPLGLKTEIQFFRQDSTFQNTKTAIDLSYYINYNTRIYLGYHSTTSSDIQNTASTALGDYKNYFATASFLFTRQNPTSFVCPVQTQISLITGIGNRAITNQTTTNTKSNQISITINAAHDFNLNRKNSFYIQNQTYYLQSEKYLVNELYRFGGFNSIRGFTENSIQAYFASTIITEYRYNLTTNLYVHSILDYSIYKNNINILETDSAKKLLAVGVGFGLQTKNGRLKFALANGTPEKQQIKFYNTIAHISYNVKF